MVRTSSRQRLILMLAALVIATAAAQIARAGTTNPEGSHEIPGFGGPPALEPFEALIGGAWHLDGSYQVFEWGVGRELVRARSYRILDGEPVLVAEGSWFWHPGDQVIRGFSSAIDMPVSLFEYVTEIDGPTFSHRLTAYGEMQDSFVEEWVLTDPDHYQWAVHGSEDEEGAPMMSGTFERVTWPLE